MDCYGVAINSQRPRKIELKGENIFEGCFTAENMVFGPTFKSFSIFECNERVTLLDIVCQREEGVGERRHKVGLRNVDGAGGCRNDCAPFTNNGDGGAIGAIECQGDRG